MLNDITREVQEIRVLLQASGQSYNVWKDQRDTEPSQENQQVVGQNFSHAGGYTRAERIC